MSHPGRITFYGLIQLLLVAAQRFEHQRTHQPLFERPLRATYRRDWQGIGHHIIEGRLVLADNSGRGTQVITII